jgi:hypothetical protein
MKADMKKDEKIQLDKVIGKLMEVADLKKGRSKNEP